MVRLGPRRVRATNAVYDATMLPTGGCSPSETTCCTDLFDIANNLLGTVLAALNACLVAGDCPSEGLSAYVTMGAGDDGIQNALTVEFDTAAPTPGSMSASGRPLPIGVSRSVFTVRLRESGWPTVQVGSKISAPEPVDQHAAARHAFSHGELMYRTLLQMRATNTIVPSTIHGCLNTVVGPLTPLRPLGGIIGFTAQVMVDLPWG